MRVMIVQSKPALCHIWAEHLKRCGLEVVVAHTGAEAMLMMEQYDLDVIVIDLVLVDGDAMTLSEYAELKQPEANLIFVTDSRFFSDGSIFAQASNARAIFQTATPPEDLAAVVQHYAQDASRAREGR